MASTYLTRTPSSATNRKTFTISTWVKRGTIGNDNQYMINAYSDANNFGALYFDVSDVLVAKLKISSVVNTSIIPSRVFRDTSAWYHIVWKVDTTQSIESDRSKLYINGVEETTFNSATYLSQNADTAFNSTAEHTIGAITTSNYFDGSMAHVHFIDGTAYDADTFGETDATTGIWKPKTAPSVTYGTNGFFLKFENSGAFGTDSSGNGNNFTVNGTMTQTIDTPSNVFATLNPLGVTGATSFANLSNGNLTYTGNSSTYGYVASTLGVSSGKYYFEAKLTQKPNTNTDIGIADLPSRTNTQMLGVSDPNSISFRGNGSVYQNNSALSWSGSTYVLNDIVGVALDLDNNRLFFSINGTWQNSADPTTSTGAISITAPENLGTTGAYFFAVGDQIGFDTAIWQCNFGNGYFGTTAVSSAQNPDDGIGIFEFTPPTGYKALCTKSINAQEYS